MSEKKINLFGKIRLSSKILKIATASLALISEKSRAEEIVNHPRVLGNEIKGSSFTPHRLWKPKLTLKLNLNDSSRNLLAYHSSHSSHSSHVSHSSHSSGGYSGGSRRSNGNGGGAVMGILAAGAIGYGLYQAGKSNRKK